jgi:hypothetical protein
MQQVHPPYSCVVELMSIRAQVRLAQHTSYHDLTMGCVPIHRLHFVDLTRGREWICRLARVSSERWIVGHRSVRGCLWVRVAMKASGVEVWPDQSRMRKAISSW